MTDRTEKGLLVDLLAKREWMRRNPTGMAALTSSKAEAWMLTRGEQRQTVRGQG
jgi:hypothetical protein